MGILDIISNILKGAFNELTNEMRSMKHKMTGRFDAVRLVSILEAFTPKG
ncbi:MAG: hypothetical protein QW590_01900 [Candidatus Bilamarchaeaceae archaeon]